MVLKCEENKTNRLKISGLNNKNSEFPGFVIFASHVPDLELKKLTNQKHQEVQREKEKVTTKGCSLQPNDQEKEGLEKEKTFR